MEKETFYGNGGFFSGNDGHASGKPFPSAFGQSEEQQVTSSEEQPDPDFKNSNRRYDNYFLHYSSWL